MKSRIIYPEKLWYNKQFHELSQSSALMAIYLVSNGVIGLCPIYECKDLRMMFDLKISESQLEKNKKELKESGLFDFYQEWVFVKNDFSYCDYYGRDRVMKSKEKEEKSIPLEVSEYFKGLIRGYEVVSNPYINNKPKTIIEKYNKREDVKEGDLAEVAQKQQVPIDFVRSKFEDVCNWEDEKPGRMKGRNWKLTLINWVKRDKVKILEKINDGRKKFVVIPPEPGNLFSTE